MVDPGRLQFHDAVVPVLADGRYRLRVETALPGALNAAPPGPQTFDVLVGGPAPEAARIRCYPPSGSTGDFTDDLPFVVLERRTLPWERAGFGIAGTPWLALVLTRDDGTPEATLVPPAGGAGEGPAGTLRAVDLATQTRLLPRPDEVTRLAHVRESSPSDSGDDDGWQAVVVANRLARAPGRWRLTLVALDDRADLAGNAPTLGLAAVWSATYTITGEGGGFGARIAAIEPTRFGDPTRASIPTDATGAVALDWADRSGRTAPVRYRPPLVASATIGGAAPAADAPPDVTEISAGELGRLLAIADPRLLGELAGWHRQQQAQGVRAAQQHTLAGGVLDGRRAGPAGIDAESLRLAALDRWQEARLPVAGRFGSTSAPTPSGNWSQAAGSDPEKLRLLPSFRGRSGGRSRGVVQAAAAAMPSEYVVSALQAAGRLLGVPLAFLAPHPALLPAESLQFFVIDRAWVRALQRGLLAAGTPRPIPDAELDGLLEQLLPQPVPLTGLMFRSSLVSDYPTLAVRAWTGSLGPEDDPDDPRHGATPVTLLRAERLTPSSLLAVFERVPDLVVIDEPHGSVRLGVSREPGGPPVVRLRAGDATLYEVANVPVDVPVPFRGDPADGIVDLTALAAGLQTAIAAAGLAGLPDPRTSSGGLALQLLAAPVRQRYQRGVVR
ncbi:hypothetical protein [Microlunatus ginsengisoli]|uniref:Uncharacterized protein n=1 Tax=Microlunatus ginsengisoli TaxID=363863 RepID=A0ABP7A1W5_9ACTN